MPGTPQPSRFAGYTPANYTMVPDQLFDEQLPDLSGAELKVLLYIIRHTFGWKKDSDNISLSQMVNGITRRDGSRIDRGTGVSKRTLLVVLRDLEDKGFIITTRRRSLEKGDEPTNYRLNVRGASQGEEGTAYPVVQKLRQGGGEQIAPGPRGRNFATQETILQETTIHNSNDSKGTQAEEIVKGLATPAPKELAEFVGNDDVVQPTRAAKTHAPRTGSQRTTSALIRMAVTTHLDTVVRATSEDFHDEAHIPSNIVQARNLLATSQMEEQAFVDLVYQARTITKQQGNIRKLAGNQSQRNRIPYFFAVLRDLLAIDEEPAPLLLTEEELQQALDVRPLHEHESDPGA